MLGQPRVAAQRRTPKIRASLVQKELKRAPREMFVCVCTFLGISVMNGSIDLLRLEYSNGQKYGPSIILDSLAILDTCVFEA